MGRHALELLQVIGNAEMQFIDEEDLEATVDEDALAEYEQADGYTAEWMLSECPAITVLC